MCHYGWRRGRGGKKEKRDMRTPLWCRQRRGRGRRCRHRIHVSAWVVMSNDERRGQDVEESNRCHISIVLAACERESNRHTHTHTLAYTHIHTHSHTHTYTHTHTHIHNISHTHTQFLVHVQSSLHM